MLCMLCLISKTGYYVRYKRNNCRIGCEEPCNKINPKGQTAWLGRCLLNIYLCGMTIEHLKSMRDRVLVLGRFL